MSKKKIILTITGIGALYVLISILGSENALIDRFPEHDAKSVRKAHRQFLRDVLTQKRSIPDNPTDAEMDAIFRTHYLPALQSV